MFLLQIWVALSLTIVARAYESVEDAARIARQLVDLSPDSVGTMATVFPQADAHLGGLPFALQEYYASCHQNGSLTLLFLPISRHSRNIVHFPNQSASITIAAPHPSAEKARVSLLGNVSVYRNNSAVPDLDAIRQCYLAKHPDAKDWLPDDDDAAHVSYWARFDPHSVYFVGGFGDQHYIGFVPLHLYQDASFREHGFQSGGRSVGGRILVEQT